MDLPNTLTLESLEEAKNDYDINKDNDIIDNDKSVFSYIEDIPYYDAGKLIDMGVYNAINTSNFFDTLPDNLVIGEDINTHKWFEQYELLCAGIVTQEYIDLSKQRTKRLRELYSDYEQIKESGDINLINARKQSILELGHNPEVPFDLKTRLKINQMRRVELECKLKRTIKNNTPINESQEIIKEVKEFPVGFDQDGNLLIKNMKKLNYDLEYSKSHKLLKTYEKTNNIFPMAYELCKLWFMNSLLEEQIYNDKTTPETKGKLFTIRSKILNDFNRYLPIVCEHEKGFNFTEYYNNTPFSDAVYKINHSTIKYAIDLLKNIKLLFLP